MQQNAAGLTIGRLAAEAGVNVETIRHYQRLGLIEEPARPAQGYRRYPEADVARIRFIKRAQQLGFSLKEIKGLLSLGERGQCREVQRLAAQKLENIEQRLRDLEAMRKVLAELVVQCENGESETHCPLIESLTHTGPNISPASR